MFILEAGVLQTRLRLRAGCQLRPWAIGSAIRRAGATECQSLGHSIIGSVPIVARNSQWLCIAPPPADWSHRTRGQIQQGPITSVCFPPRGMYQTISQMWVNIFL